MVENIVEKGENAGLLFLQCFQKAFFSRLLNVKILWKRVKHKSNDGTNLHTTWLKTNCKIKQDVFVKHECPRNGHFLSNITFIFDLELCR